MAISIPDRPIYVPCDWAAHICEALAVCLNTSRDGMELEAAREIGKSLLELYPDLAHENPYLKVILRD
jgi:hypothetical protein